MGEMKSLYERATASELYPKLIRVRAAGGMKLMVALNAAARLALEESTVVEVEHNHQIYRAEPGRILAAIEQTVRREVPNERERNTEETTQKKTCP